MNASFSGARLCTARQQAGHTITSLGAAVGRSAFSVIRWESGKACPSAEVLARLTVVLGRPFEYFYTGNSDA
jgi:transcriptional regulator with XRE-family HTH domain